MKARFLTDIVQRRAPGSRVRTLTEDLAFLDSKGVKHRANAGFQHNGPSFPIIVGGDGEASSALHDHAYSRPDIYTRAEADAMFREALEAEGMGAIRRTGWWLGVRAVGWNFFAGKPSAPELDPTDPLKTGE